MDFTGLLLTTIAAFTIAAVKTSVKHLGGLPVLLAEIAGNRGHLEDSISRKFHCVFGLLSN